MSAVSPYSEVEDIQTEVVRDKVTSVGIDNSTWTKVVASVRCYKVEVFDDAATNDFSVRHRSASDTVSELIQVGQILVKNGAVDHAESTEDSRRAMRPGDVIGWFQKATAGSMNIMVKEYTSE